MNYESRQKVRLKIKHLAPLNGCTCVFEEWIYGGQKVPKSHEFTQMTKMIIKYPSYLLLWLRSSVPVNIIKIMLRHCFWIFGTFTRVVVNHANLLWASAIKSFSEILAVLSQRHKAANLPLKPPWGKVPFTGMMSITIWDRQVWANSVDSHQTAPDQGLH